MEDFHLPEVRTPESCFDCPWWDAVLAVYAATIPPSGCYDCGRVGVLSRRRSPNPTRAVSIALTQTMIDEVDDCLGPMGSRSAWIAAAIRDKLDDSGTKLADATPFQLITVLLNRDLISEELWEALKHQFSSKS